MRLPGRITDQSPLSIYQHVPGTRFALAPSHFSKPVVHLRVGGHSRKAAISNWYRCARALRTLKQDIPKKAPKWETPYVFVTEPKRPLTTSTVRKIVTRAGEEAGIGFPLHPHMLRHSTGFTMANEGHDARAVQHYLGHENIRHTVGYTELSADRFNGFCED